MAKKLLITSLFIITVVAFALSGCGSNSVAESEIVPTATVETTQNNSSTPDPSQIYDLGTVTLGRLVSSYRNEVRQRLSEKKSFFQWQIFWTNSIGKWPIKNYDAQSITVENGQEETLWYPLTFTYQGDNSPRLAYTNMDGMICTTQLEDDDYPEVEGALHNDDGIIYDSVNGYLLTSNGDVITLSDHSHMVTYSANESDSQLNLWKYDKLIATSKVPSSAIFYGYDEVTNGFIFYDEVSGNYNIISIVGGNSFSQTIND